MPYRWTNRGVFTVANTAISSSADIRQAAFVGAAPVAGTVADLNTLADLKAISTEAAASGYARADLSAVTLTESDASDNVTLTAAAPTYLSVASGETWTFAAYYIEGASDAARTLLCIDVTASSLVTDGSNVVGPALNVTITGS